MAVKKKVFLITTLSLLLFGAWILQSNAQRPARSSLNIALDGSARRNSNTASQSSNGPQSGAPIVVQLANFGESVPVRDLPKAPGSQPRGPNNEGDEINELNTERVRKPLEGSRSVDDALQREPRAPTPNTPSAPLLTFEGIDAADEGNAVAPPDTNGDVGPNDYVETVNTLIRIYDKNGVPRGPAFRQSSLFASGGGSVFGASHDGGDPVVLYDRLADRWLISELGYISPITPPYHELIAISKSGDPTGAYYLYDFVLPGNEFPDYPKFGVWPDGYYMTTNQFLNGGSFDGSGSFAFDRKKMLAGDATAVGIYFDLNLASHPEGVAGMLPSNQNGLVSPAPGTPNIFAYFTDDDFGDPHDGLRLFDFHADFVIPSNSTFIERAESTYANPLPVALFDAREPIGRTDIEQPSPGPNLDSVGERLMFRLQYLNHGGVESLVMNWTVNVSGVPPTSSSTYQAGVRYEELRRNSPAGLFSVYDQATFAPGAGNGATGDNRWMGSAAIDNQGNLAVGYSISSTTRPPAIAYAGRESNVTGGLEVERSMMDGTGVQLDTLSRWGDYSSMSVDPSDDCTFWYAGEYYSTNSQFNWRTRIGKFRFSGCTPPAQGILSGTITACDTGASLQMAKVDVSGGPSDGFSAVTNAAGAYSIKLSPGTYTVTVSAVGDSCAPSTPVTVNVGDGATSNFSTCLSGVPKFIFQAATVSGGNGNGSIDRNECNNLSVTIRNVGCLMGSNISGTLSTSTPGVMITNPTSLYPDTPVDGASSNPVGYLINTSPSFVCGTPINFTMMVGFNGGTGTIAFAVPTCVCAPITITGSLTSTDLQQRGSLRLDNNPSRCSAPKVCPGLTDLNPRHYDIYSFRNQASLAACVTITLTSGCTSQITSAAYLGRFDPSVVCQNYLGDLANSPPAQSSYSVNVPSGGTLLVNVHETNPGLVECSSYSLTVSGLTCDNPGTLCPPTIINGSLSSGDLQQTARLSRDGTASTCTSSKACPGTLGTGPRLYDIYAFTNSAGASACLTITLAAQCDSNVNPIMSAAYLGSFNPNNLCQNYLGDLGNSPPDQTSYSVSVPAGATLLVNVHEVNPGLPGCASYTLTVSGLLCPSSCQDCAIICPPNQIATCPLTSGAAVVNYPTPITTGSCGTVTCVPASGSVFPVGTTTVNCTSTAGPKCSFTVAVDSFCLQDDNNPNNIVSVNGVTGDYVFCSRGVTLASGRGTIAKHGCAFTLDHTKGGRNVHIEVDPTANENRGSGSASIRKGAAAILQITDRKMSDDACRCSP